MIIFATIVHFIFKKILPLIKDHLSLERLVREEYHQNHITESFSKHVSKEDTPITNPPYYA